MKVFALLKSVQIFLKPLYLFQKQCESNQPNSSAIYNLLNEKIISYLNTDIPRTHLESVSLKFQKEVTNTINGFQNAIVNKWNDTIRRNWDYCVFGKNGFLYKLMVFDPFLKSQIPIDFQFYSDTMFQSINMKRKNDLIF